MVKLQRTKEEIIKKTEELAREYVAKYQGCAQCTFLAIIDALRWGGLEIIPEDMEERLFSGLTVLSGGVGMTGDGTCGAVTSSVLAISLALGIPRESQDASARRTGYATVRKAILDKYYQKYNSLLCKDVQRKYFGMAWDLTLPEMSEEFLAQSQGCTIAETAKLAVECILDEFEKGNLRGQYKIVTH